MSFRFPLKTGLAAVALVFLAGTSCAKIQTLQYNDDSFLRLELQDTPPRGRHHFATTWHFEENALVVRAERWQTCYREQTKIMERVKVTERNSKDNWIFINSVLGVVGAGAGAVLVAEPDILADKESESPKKDRDGTIYAGAGLIGVGAIFAGIAIVDMIRSIDTRKRIGEVRVPTGKRHAFACAEDRGASTRVTFEIPERFSETMSLDAEGIARFELPSAGPLSRGRLHTGILTVGDRREFVSMLQWKPYLDAFNEDLERVTKGQGGDK